MAQLIGRDAKLYAKPETTFGTMPSGNWTRLPFVSSELGAVRPLIRDDSIGVIGREEADPATDAVTATGNLVVPIDLRCFGWHLRNMFGPPTTTGVGAPYTHVFKSGGTTPPSMSGEFDFNAALSKYNDITGICYDTMDIPLGRTGWSNATFATKARNAVRNGTSAAGTVVTPAVQRFLQREGAISKDGSPLSKILSGSFRYANALEDDAELDGSGLMAGYEAGDVQVTGTIEVRLFDTTLLDAADAQTNMALQWQLTIDSSNNLTFLLPRVFLEPAKIGIKNRARVQVPINFRAVRDATAACALQVTLMNDVSSYA